MHNQNLTKKLLVFVLLAVLLALLANINQIVGLIMSNVPEPRPSHHRPHFDIGLMRLRLMWEVGITLVLSFTLICFNSGILATQPSAIRLKQRYVVAISIVAGVCLFAFLFLFFIPERRFASRFFLIIVSKAMFVIAAAIAAGQLYRLIWQKQQVELENQRLKTDSLQSRYAVLMDQVNPHFLFNSLNSLSYLIREGDQQKALTFIDELSSIFRYVLQKRSNELVTLQEEIHFTEAYRYLLDIRFEHKLFFEIRIAEADLTRRVPFLSLQPLIENAVKHNVISNKQPLAVFIYVADDMLIVSNPINSKLHEQESTGIGLSNLANRYKLLTGKSIVVANNGTTFIVKLPLV